MVKANRITMKILTIRLKNLASIEGTFEIDFQAEPLRSAGIFAISGPTGAGKSTILDALCLALYDKTPRFSASVESLYMSDIGESRVNQADVKNILRRGTGEGFAEVDFLGASGHCYRSRWSVRRTGSRANGALRSQTIQVTDLTANQELQGTRKELLAQLVTLVGLTYEQFTRTVLLAQNDFATFLKSRESAKAELLEKLTGTEIYSRISSEIYLRSKTADAELNQLKSNATLIELLSEEEITLLRTEKESLTNLREQGSKALIDLNAQLSVLHTLKLQQEQRDKKVQDMRLDEEKSKKLREEYTRQSDSLIRFRGQCEAVQPDLSRARELDVQIQSLVSQSKQVEEILQGAEKAANAQANKLQSVQGALHTSCHSLKNLTGEIELPVTEETVKGKVTERIRKINKADYDRVAKAIEEAAWQSDEVLISIHSHQLDGDAKENTAEFMVDFAHFCIDCGATAVIGHGPHLLRPIEIYKGYPIFYSLGDFITQLYNVEFGPREFYEKYSLTPHDTMYKLLKTRSKDFTVGLMEDRRMLETVIPYWETENGKLTRLELLPVMGVMKGKGPAFEMGLPKIAQDLAFMDKLAKISEPFGTKIKKENGVFVVEV